MIRAAFLVLACGIAASTAGAAAPLARNGVIAFASDRSKNPGNSEVFVVRAGGGPRLNLSRGIATTDEDPSPSWSPDGKRLAFTGYEALVIAKADGSSRTLLSEDELGAPAGEPSWSPDGRDIAVLGDGIWLIATSNWRARRIVDPPVWPEGFDSGTHWSPDGARLAFTRGTAGDFPDLYVVRRDGTGLRRLARAVSCCVSWSPSGRRLLYGDDFARLVSIDVRTGRRKRLNLGRLHLSDADDVDVVWSPRGRWIAVPTTAGLYLVSPDGRTRRRVWGVTGTPAWSPSGNALALGGDGVYTLSLKGRRLRRVIRGRCGEDVIRVDWSPRGNRIAFVSETYENDSEIYAMREDGSGLRQLTRSCERHEREPAWSPDGRRLAYTVEQAIYVMRGDGSRRRRLTQGMSPSWSPDGRSIVFERSLSRTRDLELFTMRADGRRVRQLTRTSGYNVDPAWSPRGDKIAFVGTPPGAPRQIYVMNRDGSRPVALAHGLEPSWSPDGSRIAFVREYNVWTMNADGTDPVRLTSRDLYTAVNDPAWSPDGTKIVYAADIDQGRSVQDALFVIPAGGGTPRMLPYERENNVEPSWQPLP